MLSAVSHEANGESLILLAQASEAVTFDKRLSAFVPGTAFAGAGKPQFRHFLGKRMQ